MSRRSDRIFKMATGIERTLLFLLRNESTKGTTREEQAKALFAFRSKTIKEHEERTEKQYENETEQITERQEKQNDNEARKKRIENGQKENNTEEVKYQINEQGLIAEEEKGITREDQAKTLFSFHQKIMKEHEEMTEKQSQKETGQILELQVKPKNNEAINKTIECGQRANTSEILEYQDNEQGLIEEEEERTRRKEQANVLFAFRQKTIKEHEVMIEKQYEHGTAQIMERQEKQNVEARNKTMDYGQKANNNEEIEYQINEQGPIAEKEEGTTREERAQDLFPFDPETINKHEEVAERQFQEETEQIVEKQNENEAVNETVEHGREANKNELEYQGQPPINEQDLIEEEEEGTARADQAKGLFVFHQKTIKERENNCPKEIEKIIEGQGKQNDNKTIQHRHKANNNENVEYRGSEQGSFSKHTLENNTSSSGSEYIPDTDISSDYETEQEDFEIPLIKPIFFNTSIECSSTTESSPVDLPSTSGNNIKETRTGRKSMHLIF